MLAAPDGNARRRRFVVIGPGRTDLRSQEPTMRMKNQAHTQARTPPLAALRLAALVLAAATLGAALPAAAAEVAPGTEELHYRWNLGRLLGRMAGVFLPSEGDGVMTLKPANGNLVTELVITSEHSREGEFWRYGSQIDPRSGYAEKAWSSYRWRGEAKSKRDDLGGGSVTDIVSGIYAIRRDPPAATRHMEIWSDGKIYPVMVIPKGEATRKIDGKAVATRHYTVRGYKTPDGRFWKGALELWLAKDAAATPVEIHITRDLAALQLRLQTLP
jgi:hypothetical protein